MNISRFKNRATSQCSSQRHNVPESLNSNVVTFGLKSLHYREARFSTLRIGQEVYFQRHDVIEGSSFNIETLHRRMFSTSRR